MKNKNLTLFVGIIAFFFGASALYLVIYFFPTNENYQKDGNDKKQVTIEKEVTITDKGIADAVEKIYDSVVVVENYQNNRLAGSGTGFVYKTINDKSYIMTNYHVVAKATKVAVTFTNKEKIEVKILGGDEYADIAVLEIETKYISQVAIMGKSEVTRPGDTVFTVGAPLDNNYSGTTTRGIISGKERFVDVNIGSFFTPKYNVLKVIQTDASINNGNSGGPLANSNGEVIGVTSLKLISSGVEGIGFAIPIEDALYFANLYEKGEKLIRPSLGVEVSNVKDFKDNSSISPNIKIDDKLKEGAVIVKIVENSPAKTSGLEEGDVVIKIDDYQITSSSSLRYYLYKHQVGDTLNFRVNRKGTDKNISVKLTKSAEEK